MIIARVYTLHKESISASTGIPEQEVESVAYCSNVCYNERGAEELHVHVATVLKSLQV
jgi:hypothetical protein